MSKENPVPEEGKDNVFDDNFDTIWGDEEVEEEAVSEDTSEEESETDEKVSSKKPEDQSEQQDNSAIFQKKRYRELYKESQARVKELEQQVKGGNPLSPEEEKEKAAEEFLSTKIRDILQKLDEEKQIAKRQQTEAFQTELEEVLDENQNFTEEQILSVTEELGVSPRQAIKVIERERKLTKREKPTVPKERRAAVKATNQSTEEKKKPSSLDAVNRRIKDMLGRGEL